MKKHVCKICNHKWIPRIATLPVQCPKCKRLDWNKSVNVKKDI
jgi:ribosomal protein L37AE/L43A